MTEQADYYYYYYDLLAQLLIVRAGWLTVCVYVGDGRRISFDFLDESLCPPFVYSTLYIYTPLLSLPLFLAFAPSFRLLCGQCTRIPGWLAGLLLRARRMFCFDSYHACRGRLVEERDALISEHGHCEMIRKRSQRTSKRTEAIMLPSGD